jgi:hypothetical protein
MSALEMSMHYWYGRYWADFVEKPQIGSLSKNDFFPRLHLFECGQAHVAPARLAG